MVSRGLIGGAGGYRGPRVRTRREDAPLRWPLGETSRSCESGIGDEKGERDIYIYLCIRWLSVRLDSSRSQTAAQDDDGGFERSSSVRSQESGSRSGLHWLISCAPFSQVVRVQPASSHPPMSEWPGRDKTPTMLAAGAQSPSKKVAGRGGIRKLPLQVCNVGLERVCRWRLMVACGWFWM